VIEIDACPSIFDTAAMSTPAGLVVTGLSLFVAEWVIGALRGRWCLSSCQIPAIVGGLTCGFVGVSRPSHVRQGFAGVIREGRRSQT
jgi:hypothetical protein